MIATTWNSVSIYLIDDEADWRSSVRGGFEFALATEVGLSNRETRRPMGKTLRTVLQFPIVASGPAATRLAAGLRAWQSEPVAVPFWPGVGLWENRESAPITSKLKIVFRHDFGDWELFEDVEPEWPVAGDLVAPVLMGRIARSDPTWLTPTTCRFDVDFEETSPADYALTVVSQAWEDGPEPSDAWSGAAPKLMPMRLHYESPTLGSTVDMEREQIGFGRAPTETLYAQENRRRGTAPFVEGTAADIATLLRFFADHGEGQPFWAPSWSAAAILTGAVGEFDVTVAVAPDHGVKDGDWLMFSDLATEAVSRVTTAAPTLLTLPVAIGALPIQALASHLLLCRFERPRIQVDWLSARVAKASLAIREVPPEYTPAADETLGTTIGKLPVRAWLYELREPTSDAGATIRRFTSFEHDLVVAGDTYHAAQIDHGSIRHGIALDRDNVDVRFAVTPADSSHPLVRLATLRCEAPIRLTIRRIALKFNPT